MVELETRFGNKLDCELHRGDGGAFEVAIDGAPVFSKLATGRFPAKGQIAGIVADRLKNLKKS